MVWRVRHLKKKLPFCQCSHLDTPSTSNVSMTSKLNALWIWVMTKWLQWQLGMTQSRQMSWMQPKKILATAEDSWVTLKVDNSWLGMASLKWSILTHLCKNGEFLIRNQNCARLVNHVRLLHPLDSRNSNNLLARTLSHRQRPKLHVQMSDSWTSKCVFSMSWQSTTLE